MPCFRCIEEDGRTLLLNRRSLSRRENVLDLQTFLSLLKVLLACPIRAMTSLAVDPVFSMVLPRYLEWTTCSTSLSPHLMFIGKPLVAIPLVLLALMLSPKPSVFCWTFESSTWSRDLQVSRGQQNLGRSAGDHLGVAQLSRRSSVRNR